MRTASAEFVADVDSFGPARDIYESNTRAAAERIRAFVSEGIAAGVFRSVHAAFVAEMVSATIAAIQRGVVRRRAGLSDAEAFTELAALVLRALQPDSAVVVATPAESRSVRRTKPGRARKAGAT
jgi:hypothetical protein